jgi:hypothetical protein
VQSLLLSILTSSIWTILVLCKSYWLASISLVVLELEATPQLVVVALRLVVI